MSHALSPFPLPFREIDTISMNKRLGTVVIVHTSFPALKLSFPPPPPDPAVKARYNCSCLPWLNYDLRISPGLAHRWAKNTPCS